MTLRMWAYPWLTWATLAGLAGLVALMLFDDAARPALVDRGARGRDRGGVRGTGVAAWEGCAGAMMIVARTGRGTGPTRAVPDRGVGVCRTEAEAGVGAATDLVARPRLCQRAPLAGDGDRVPRGSRRPAPPGPPGRSARRAGPGRVRVLAVPPAAGHPPPGPGVAVHVLPDLRANRGPVADAAAVLGRYVREHDLHDVVVVAHSKGGLIGKLAMVSEDPDGRIDSMIAINTPFAGSTLARWFVAPAVRAFVPSDATIVALSAELAVNERITSVHSRWDPHIPGGSALVGAQDVVLDTRGTSDLWRTRDCTSSWSSGSSGPRSGELQDAGQAGRLRVVDDLDAVQPGPDHVRELPG
ncbi:hypothetical protein NKG05_10670 [Oerskovia sp. M15]